MNWMLDFHYSDFWADPARQLIPKAWQGYDIEKLESAVYEYTRDILQKCKDEGLYPAYTQIGNEITNGTLWPEAKVNYDEKTGKPLSYDNLMRILKAGSRAARESGNTKIIYHLERSGDNERYRCWFDAAVKAGAPFDIIGISYYSHWHGTMDKVQFNLEDISKRYDKDVMIVETSYPFTVKHYSDKSDINLVINESMYAAGGKTAPYPLSIEGQRKFIADITAMARSINRCKGLYYWEPAWLALPGSTWATPEARKYIDEEHKHSGNEWANQCLFDYQGNLLPAIKEFTK
jgi:arabinogalactan endo-1,4-beta-galactosidase